MTQMLTDCTLLLHIIHHNLVNFSFPTATGNTDIGMRRTIVPIDTCQCPCAKITSPSYAPYTSYRTLPACHLQGYKIIRSACQLIISKSVCADYRCLDGMIVHIK